MTSAPLCRSAHLLKAGVSGAQADPAALAIPPIARRPHAKHRAADAWTGRGLRSGHSMPVSIS